jgi:hypothetical protein
MIQAKSILKRNSKIFKKNKKTGKGISVTLRYLKNITKNLELPSDKIVKSAGIVFLGCNFLNQKARMKCCSRLDCTKDGLFILWVDKNGEVIECLFPADKFEVVGESLFALKKEESKRDLAASISCAVIFLVEKGIVTISVADALWLASTREIDAYLFDSNERARQEISADIKSELEAEAKAEAEAEAEKKAILVISVPNFSGKDVMLMLAEKTGKEVLPE